MFLFDVSKKRWQDQYAHEVFQDKHGNKKPRLASVKSAVKGFTEAFQSEENN